ncbi:MAG: sulfotransferase [Parvularculaceae bacterium]|nr:sulfotransferase [Parvularculaceae bacterium]
MTTPEHFALTEMHGKDPAAEARLARLNEVLAPVEANLTEGLVAPKRAMVFVVGPPRGGTTLMSQILAVSGGYSYVSNVAARFWRAPSLGVTIDRALQTSPPALSFASRRGATSGAAEPHEFGYFWSRWFDLGGETHWLDEDARARVDLAELRRALAGMERAAERPMVFKNNTWLTFQADWFARALPNALIVACFRDPAAIARSLLRQRLELYGDPARWWSVRPRAYAALSRLEPLDQIAGQAVECLRDMQDALSRVPTERLLRVGYGALCADPRGILNEIAAACAGLGTPIDLAGSASRIPAAFTPTDPLAPPTSVEQVLTDCVRRRLSQAPLGDMPL